MSAGRPVRIRVERLVLDGLPAGATPAAVEQALRAALREAFAGGRVPDRATVVPRVQVAGGGDGSLVGAARAAAGAVAGAVRGAR